MKTKDAVKERIIELCREKDLTINGLATLAALPPSTLKGIIYDNSKNPGVVTIKILCDGLGISLKEFFDAKVFDDLEQEIE
ncbi:MAG: helix-turn-helix transcriptional regulator [Eubacterium sp.]|nr:helix-turn-helix transcriptional regulator [Eubacterium sp.]